MHLPDPVFAQGEIRHSILSSGMWYKIAVTGDSIYSINYNFLSSIGINPDQIDPRKIKIFGNGGKMLPQAMNKPRPIDLIENHIYISGEDDGEFNASDYILFYGRGADTYRFDVDTRQMEYENNDYSDTSYYYINISDKVGKRLAIQENAGNNFNLITEFFSYRTHEIDIYNLVISGREWYGEKFDGSSPQDFRFDFEGLLPDSPVQVTTSVLARTFVPAEFQININNDFVGSLTMPSVPDGTYSTRAKETTEVYSLSGITPSENTIMVTLDYLKANAATSIGYLDYLLVTAHSTLQLFGDQTTFRSWSSTDHGGKTYEISNIVNGGMIWDVSDPYAPKIQEFDNNGGAAIFGTESADLKHYVVFNPQLNKTPVFIGTVENQDIQGSGPANLIIVTHPLFYSEALRLGELRTTHDNLTVQVVTTEMIYNEFSSGSQDVTAIRDYLKYLWDIDHSNTGLRYVLLFGKSSYDYKRRLAINTNFVPIYESRNSQHPIYSYSSDDYYGFMEDAEGDWIETNAGDHTLEIGVGRLPVKTLDEAATVVNKIYSYTMDPEGFGEWRNRMIFVADDGDNGLHQRQANMLADTVTAKNGNLNIQKLYLDAFPQITLPGREIAPKANAYLDKIIEQGTLIVNFTGHGNEDQWTHEAILDLIMIDKWSNEKKLPIFITATCEFGRHDNPEKISGGEQMILKENGGGIALVTTARPVFASQNFELNNAFYQAAFKNGYRLGDIFTETKNNSLSGSVNRNFSLLGDPSLQIAFPREKVMIDSINGKALDDPDTLRALARIRLKGSVRSIDDVKNENFNGIVDVLIFEKPTIKETLGNKTPVYLYEERDNILFKGKATVFNGEFSIEFVMPKNILYYYGKGKISMYAVSQELQSDATGATDQIVVGGSTTKVIADSDPPDIRIYLGDTTFVSGQIIKPNTLLIARLFDESGITTSNSGFGQDLQATLDGDSTFFIKEFYTSDIDNYKSGWVRVPINGLETGEHSLTVKAWDTHNNPAEETINFIVSEKNQLVLEKLRNYPNPFSDVTKFTFEHNRTGEDLRVSVFIFNSNGALVREAQYELIESFAKVEGLAWDGRNSSGEKLTPGIYFYKVLVRSMIDGASSQMYQKLIIN